MIDKRTWAVEDHLCKACGGRILRCVTGCGNTIFKCADCGRSQSAMGPDVLCWCGFSHRGNRDNAYTCQPFSVLKERPELLSAFRACGCSPERGEVGIMLERDLRAAMP